MIEQLIVALRAAGKDLDWRDLADVLWLSHVRGPMSTELPAQDHSPTGAAAHDEIAESPTRAPIQGVQGSTAESAPATGLKPTLRRGVTGEGTGLTFDTRRPARYTLPGQLEIGRALRPFKQSRRSRRDRVFDTATTIDHYCATKVLVALMKPARERWFHDVALVVDGGPTMVVWRETITALADLLERHGAFDRLTRWTLSGNEDEVHVESTTGLRHDPRELVDYNGRRLILVVTDCVGPLWHGTAAWAVLCDWGCFAPVALVQTLPARLWSATALGDADVAITSGRRGEPNRRLRLRPPWWWDEDDPPEQATPVVTLKGNRLSAWARMVMGTGGVEVTGVVTQPPHPADPGAAAAPIDAKARVATFRATASEEAGQLATLLSAVDVSLPVARIVLNALIPHAGEIHLAEVLVGGLLQPTRLADDPSSAETYDFVPGVREVLQESLTTTVTIDVWRAVAPYLEVATGQRPPFSTLLAFGAPASSSSEDSALSHIATDLINRLGLIDSLPTIPTGNAIIGASAAATSMNLPTDVTATAPAPSAPRPSLDMAAVTANPRVGDLMTNPVLTIDFGTSYSSAMIVGAARPIAEPVTGSYSWPSSVYLQGDTLLVGTLAERKKRTKPAAFRTEFKRELGAQQPVFLGERTFTPVELITAVIRALKTEAERGHGGPIDRTVLTIPSSYLPGDPRRALMIQAGETAGFGAVELLPEPVAAAFAPGVTPENGDLLLVYDFGGGTFDTAVVHMGPDKHTVLGHAALDDCGGRDIDALVGAKVLEEGKEWLGLLVGEAVGIEGDIRLRMAVGDFAQRVKHQLTDSTMVADFLTPITPAYRMARTELAKLVEPQVRRTVDCVRRLLRRLDIDIQDIDAVLLVGGSSRMPVVAETLTRELARPLHRPEDPDLAVVLGAAEWFRHRSPAVLIAEAHPPGLPPLL